MPTIELILSNASGVPFYRQIVDQMADMVRAGTLSPGSRLASVRELALQLQVSLITVRRAYADLEAAGLIVRRQGQGTFVAEDVGQAAAEQARTDAEAALTQAVERQHDSSDSPTTTSPPSSPDTSPTQGALMTDALVQLNDVFCTRGSLSSTSQSGP